MLLSLSRVSQSVIRSRTCHRTFAASTDPLSTNTVVGLLDVQVENFGLKDAVHVDDQKIRWTFQELKRHSDAFAFGLLELGFQSGDKLAVWLGNTSEHLVAQIGAAQVGITIVGIHETNSAEELKNALSHSRAKGMLFAPDAKTNNSRHVELVSQLLPELTTLTPGAVLKAKSTPQLQHVFHTGHRNIPGSTRFKNAFLYSSSAFRVHQLPPVTAQTPFYVHYAAGSQKGSSITHQQAVQGATTARDALKLTNDDQVLLAAPLSKPFGAVAGALSSLAAASLLVVSDMSSQSIERALGMHQCNVLVADAATFPSQLSTSKTSLRAGLVGMSQQQAMPPVLSSLTVPNLSCVDIESLKPLKQ